MFDSANWEHAMTSFPSFSTQSIVASLTVTGTTLYMVTKQNKQTKKASSNTFSAHEQKETD